MLRRGWKLTAFLCSCLILPAAGWSADIVTLRDGSRVSGEITGATKNDLTIKPTIGDARKIPSSDVAAVDWDDATADLKLGISDENGGRFDSAIARVTKSKTDSSGAGDLLKLEFDYVLARIAARQALADATKIDAAISQLDAFRKAGSDHFRYYDAVSRLGQLQLEKDDYTAAQATYALLEASNSPEYKLAAKIAQGRIEMAQGQSDAAIKTFDSAISAAGKSPAEQLRKFEAMLGKARAQAQESQHTEALAALEEVTSAAPTDATDLLAEAYVLEGRSLQALNRNKEAVLAYLHVDVLFPRESNLHAEALYHLARLWKTVQAPERGLEAEAKLTASYPNSEWTKKLAESGQ